MRRINASEFKAKCLSILDRVAKSGEPLSILKRGREVARLVPPAGTDEMVPQRTLRGKAKTLGDLISPVVPAEEWESAGDP